MKKAPYPIVEIIWLDSESDEDSQWLDIEKVIQASEGLECRTIGYLVYEASDRVIIATSIDQKSNKLHGNITIPKVAIKERREVGLKRRVKEVKPLIYDPINQG